MSLSAWSFPADSLVWLLACEQSLPLGLRMWSLQLLEYTCRNLGCSAVLPRFAGSCITAGNKNKLLGCICTEKFWFSHNLFCCVSKQIENQYFSNCCSVCTLFSQLSVIPSSWLFNCSKWYTVKIFCFPRAKWTFARSDYSVELGNRYLNLCQFFKIRKKKILRLLLN